MNSNVQHALVLGDKKDSTAITLFENYTLGVATNRDAWVYNYSCKNLIANMSDLVRFYNKQVNLLKESRINEVISDLDNFIDNDPKKISWTDLLKRDLDREITHKFDKNHIVNGLYRPFTRSNLYFDKAFNQRQYQLPNIFPKSSLENLVISVTGRGATKGFSSLITNYIPDLEMISKGQCFPLYLYEKKDLTKGHNDLFDQDNDVVQEEEYTRKDAITDEALKHFQDAYPNNAITKEDLFYYIYGLLHSEEYREKYADNLTKQLPRIPRVKTYKDFAHFSNAGRELAELHLNYETIDIHDNVKLKGKNGYTVTKQAVKGGADSDYYVTKMKFGKKKDPETGKNVNDLSTVIYNNFITIENIPEEAYDYVVNGKPALEWVMERQSVTTHKASGITNDANDWAIETMNNPRYPLELFLRVITVSLETQKIVNSLPKLDLLVN